MGHAVEPTGSRSFSMRTRSSLWSYWRSSWCRRSPTQWVAHRFYW